MSYSVKREEADFFTIPAKRFTALAQTGRGAAEEAYFVWPSGAGRSLPGTAGGLSNNGREFASIGMPAPGWQCDATFCGTAAGHSRLWPHHRSGSDKRPLIVFSAREVRVEISTVV